MPNWVMVPVPAEHEQSVLQRVIVLGMAASGGVTWSPELLARHFDALAPEARALATRGCAPHPRQPAGRGHGAGGAVRDERA